MTTVLNPEAVGPPTQFLTGSCWIESSDQRPFDADDRASNEILAVVASSSTGDGLGAVAVAHTPLPSWSLKPARQPAKFTRAGYRRHAIVSSLVGSFQQSVPPLRLWSNTRPSSALVRVHTAHARSPLPTLDSLIINQAQEAGLAQGPRLLARDRFECARSGFIRGHESASTPERSSVTLTSDGKQV